MDICVYGYMCVLSSFFFFFLSLLRVLSLFNLLFCQTTFQDIVLIIFPHTAGQIFLRSHLPQALGFLMGARRVVEEQQRGTELSKTSLPLGIFRRKRQTMSSVNSTRIR